MKLDAYSNNAPIGTLEQVDLTSYVFTYAPGCTDDQSISLLMRPSVKREWEHRFLHPVFQVSLPEGALRQVLTRNYAKQFDHFGDTELLATVGSHLVGRNKVTPHGSPLVTESPTENLRDLLSNTTDEMLEHYLEVHAQFSGVSGSFNKYLAKSPVGAQDSSRTTLTFDHWIVKSDDDGHPGLVFNEYHAMRLPSLMGLPTAAFHVSDDFSRLAVKRFDFDESGKNLGFEDMCALNALNADQKFSGSVERVIKAINAFCAPANVKASREQFFAQYITCMAIRNGDAHLKNFGLLYSTLEDVNISPVYDMVTMSAYAARRQNSEDALDEPAMSLNGVRRWPDEKAIAYLAARCGINATKSAEIAQNMAKAMTTVSEEIAESAQENEQFRPMAKRMLELWGCGLRAHDAERAQAITDLAGEIDTQDEVYRKAARLRM